MNCDEMNWMGYCSLCLKNSEISGGDLKTSPISLRYLCKHLKIEFKQLFFKCIRNIQKEQVGLLDVKTNLEEAEVNLCLECGKMIEMFSDVFKQLEKIQIEMEWCLEEIQKVVIKSDKDEGLVKRLDDLGEGGDMNSLIWTEMIKRLRKSILGKPDPESVPLKATLRLKRCAWKSGKKVEVPKRPKTSKRQDISAVSASNLEDSSIVKEELHCPESDAVSIPDMDSFSDVESWNFANNQDNSQLETKLTEMVDGGLVGIKTSVESKPQEEDGDRSWEGSSEESSDEDDHSWKGPSRASSDEHVARRRRRSYKYKKVAVRKKKVYKPEILSNQIIANGTRLPGTKKIECNECKKIYADVSTFGAHFRTIHLKERDYKCHLCLKEFAGRYKLNRHLRNVHADLIQSIPASTTQATFEIEFKCDFGDCDYVAKSMKEFKKHELVCTGLSSGSQVYQNVPHCQFCKEEFRSKILLKRHQCQEKINSESRPTEFKCDLGDCNYTTKIKYRLSLHKRICKGTMRLPKVNNFTCNSCGRGFTTVKNLKKHERFSHSGKVFTCSECNREFRHEVYLREHFDRIHLKIRHHCDHVGCSKSYSDKDLLRLHKITCEKPPPSPKPLAKYEGDEIEFSELEQMKVEEPEGPDYTFEDANEHCVQLPENKYQCKICNLTLTELKGYRRHFARIHVKDKAFECSDCSKKFSRRSELNAHIRRVHANGELFRCDKGECQYTTKTESYLRQHQQRCEGLLNPNHLESVRDHMCSICGKLYKSRDYLKKHHNRVHGGRKFVCDQCGKAFTAKEGLRVHNRREHLGIRHSCGNPGCGKQFKSVTSLKGHRSGCLYKPNDCVQEVVQGTS